MKKSEPFIIGLTGSIGMGKSTTASMFADAGIAVWNADAAVHRMYAKGGAAVEPIRAIFENAVTNGQIDRAILKAAIATDHEALKVIEQIVHPLVSLDRAEFIAQTNSDIVVLDIPLLFESGLENVCDLTVVVSTSADEQKKRVLSRKGMTEAQFTLMLSQQLPDAEKRAKADIQITTFDMESTRAAVSDLISQIREKNEIA